MKDRVTSFFWIVREFSSRRELSRSPPRMERAAGSRTKAKRKRMRVRRERRMRSGFFHGECFSPFLRSLRISSWVKCMILKNEKGLYVYSFWLFLWMSW